MACSKQLYNLGKTGRRTGITGLRHNTEDNGLTGGWAPVGNGLLVDHRTHTFSIHIPSP